MQVIDFYEYYEGLQEGWDGPALLVFSDGNKIGARLDRNGLRPARYWETDDGMVYVASEVGVLGDVLTNASHVVRKGRLGPGQMVCADLHEVSHICLLWRLLHDTCKIFGVYMVMWRLLLTFTPFAFLPRMASCLQPVCHAAAIIPLRKPDHNGMAYYGFWVDISVRGHSQSSFDCPQLRYLFTLKTLQSAYSDARYNHCWCL